VLTVLAVSWVLMLLLMMAVSEMLLPILAVSVLDPKLGLCGSVVSLSPLLAMLELAAVAILYTLLGAVLLA